MLRFGRFRFIVLLSTVLVALTMISVDYAEARRGGSFGSRGTRTFQSAPPTRTAPNPNGPVDRTMTPAPAQTPNAAARQQTASPQRPGLFGGLGGGLMRGLVIGGLVGMLMGYGFGGMAGALGFLVQLLLVGLVVYLVMGFLRSRRTPAAAGGAPLGGNAPFGGGNTGLENEPTRRDAADGAAPGRAGGFSIPSIGSSNAASAPVSQDFAVEQSDLQTFERLLSEVQQALSDEDHAALRRLSTPEMVSFFSEELAENAKSGLRNEVRDVRLVQADIAESWREENEDYATAAFQYESIDLMRDRGTGEIAEGNEEPSDTTELWTFVRPQGGDWKLSAIQQA